MSAEGGDPPYGENPPKGDQPPYGQPGSSGQPSAYGAGGWGYPLARTDSSAIWALVLAVASFVVCPVVPAIVALVLAGSAERAIAASGGLLTGEGLVKAARIVAWVNIGLSLAAVVFSLVLVLVAGVVSTGP
jgi:hypothetical protein